MSVSIIDKLQQGVNPEVAFADVKSNFSSPNDLVKDLKPSLPDLNTDNFKIDSFNLSPLDKAVADVPISNNELNTTLSSQVNQLNTINLNTLTAEIPDSPSADNFQDIEVVNDIQNNITNLSRDLTGNLAIGSVSKVDNIPSGSEDIFNEFNQFATNAGMLPVRTLDALLKVFKKLLDKLSNPEQLLQLLGTEALTDIFKEQIQSLQAQLPSEAITIIAQNIETRQQIIKDYNTQFSEFIALVDELKSGQSILTTNEIQRRKDEIKAIRQTLKQISNQIKQLDESTEKAIDSLKSFKIGDFQTKLENIAQTNSEVLVLQPLFDFINKYLDEIKSKIETITNNLRDFTQKIPILIDEGIEKVESIATQITEGISQKITEGQEVLIKLKNYLSGIIKEIRDFIEKTAKQSSELVKPFKDISNKASSTVVTQIDKISQQITDATSKLEQSIGEVNQKIENNLNREELTRKINNFLDTVTKILEGEEVKNALTTAENGIKTIKTNLEKVTLKPAFTTVVNKSGELEIKLKEIDVSTLSSPSKAALKVGTSVIKQVDIAGTVTPELKDAFQEILNPLENIIILVEGQFQAIDQKIQSFAPSSLIDSYLTPYLQPVITELENYKPSILLQPIKDFYNSLLEKMEGINPNQLLEKLEEFYQKLVTVIESLSPETITDFLNEQLKKVTGNLDKLPVEDLMETIKGKLGQLDQLMASLGLDSVLKLDFWINLKEILSFSFADKIKEIEDIRDQVTEKIGEIDDSILTQQMEEFKSAINDYAGNPEIAINIDSITTAKDDYQAEIANLQSLDVLNGFTPPAELMIDYSDLKKRFEDIYNLLTVSGVDDSLLQQALEETRRLKSTQPSRDNLVTTANNVLTSELIKSFKDVIPNEINIQIINPLTEILNKLDEILKNPQAILGDIEKVMEKIASAPQEITAILGDVTTTLGNKIREAINTLKNSINELTQEVNKALKETHKIIVETVKFLNPRRLLHTFAETDFSEGKLITLMALIKQPPSNDLVSLYINNQLSVNTQTLLNDITLPNAKNEFIKDLNNLLLDENFYRADRFKHITLSQQAESLRLEIKQLRDKETKTEEEKNKIENDVILFNRLLLEAHYNGDKPPEERIILMNIESIFPYLLQKLKEIYPQSVVDELNKTHQKIIQLVIDIPEAIGDALDEQYRTKVLEKTQALREGIDNIFKELRGKLEQLKSELDIGLEEVADSFDRLISALPV